MAFGFVGWFKRKPEGIPLKNEFAELSRLHSTRRIPEFISPPVFGDYCRHEFTFTSTEPMKKPVNKMNLPEARKEINRLRAEANALTNVCNDRAKQIENVKLGAQHDFNGLKAQLESAQAVIRSRDHEIEQRRRVRDVAEQRAVTFGRDLAAARKTLAQNEREMENLRAINAHLRAHSVTYIGDNLVRQPVAALEALLVKTARERDEARRLVTIEQSQAAEARKTLGEMRHTFAKTLESRLSGDMQIEMVPSLLRGWASGDPYYHLTLNFEQGWRDDPTIKSLKEELQNERTLHANLRLRVRKFGEENSQ